MPPTEVPFKVRADFGREVRWGALRSGLRRYEIVAPHVQGPTLGISESFGTAHSDRSSLLVRVGGGHLRGPRDEVLRMLLERASERLQTAGLEPEEHIASVTSWLEEEQRHGVLERSYTTASLLVVVSDEDVWIWHSGPHGVIHGLIGGMRFASTDLRLPVLRELGVMPQPSFRSPATEIADRISSIFCIGTPHGYERTRIALGENEVAMALDRATLPIGPWPAEPVGLDRLWGLDAGWKYGVGGVAVAVGCISVDELAIGSEWKVMEVPLAGSAGPSTAIGE